MGVHVNTSLVKLEQMKDLSKREYSLIETSFFVSQFYTRALIHALSLAVKRL